MRQNHLPPKSDSASHSARNERDIPGLRGSPLTCGHSRHKISFTARKRLFLCLRTGVKSENWSEMVQVHLRTEVPFGLRRARLRPGKALGLRWYTLIQVLAEDPQSMPPFGCFAFAQGPLPI